MKSHQVVLVMVLAVGCWGGFSFAQNAPTSSPATTPSTRPNSETIGVRISKLTRNPDGTILAIFDTKDKQGNTIPREVLITPDTIVNNGGQLKKSSDIK